MRLAVFLSLLLILPGPLAAQAGQADEPPARASFAGAALLKVSQLAGADRVFLGGLAGFVFADRFLLGGGGMALTENVELPGSESSTGFDLGMGYGGVFLKSWTDLPHDLTGEASLLFGFGHAEVRDRLAGQEVGSDNFLALEPEISIFFNPFREVHIGLSGGYRFVSGMEDLPRVTQEDLQSFTGTLSLRLGGR